MASTVDSAAEQLSKLGIDGAFADSAPNLKKNLHLLSSEQVHVMLKCYPFFFSFFGFWIWILFIVVGIWRCYQVELAKMLMEMGQSHLFEKWAAPGVDDNEKKAFFDQVFICIVF